LSAFADIGVLRSLFIRIRFGENNMGKFRLIYSSAIAILTWNSSSAFATVYNSDGSSTSVQFIHDTLVHDGDTITLPAGSFTWSTPVYLTKAVNLLGAGTAQTTVYDNVPKPNPNGSMVMLRVATPYQGTSQRVSGFTIHGQAQDNQNYNSGTLQMSGYSHSFRVDHINFVAPGTGMIMTWGDLWGVIDHCTFDTTGRKQGVQIHHSAWNGDASGFGDLSFEDSPHLGTAEAIYIEDCVFNGASLSGAGVTDGAFGGRFVFRHNVINGGDQIAMHGTEGGAIAAYAVLRFTTTPGTCPWE
jgi:hypothetical protein